MATSMATSPVLVRGPYFWKDGRRVGQFNLLFRMSDVLTWSEFFVRGVVYQEHDSVDCSLAGRDVISDDHLEQLRHDLLLFRELGVNAVYVCRFEQGDEMLESADL